MSSTTGVDIPLQEKRTENGPNEYANLAYEPDSEEYLEPEAIKVDTNHAAEVGSNNKAHGSNDYEVMKSDVETVIDKDNNQLDSNKVGDKTRTIDSENSYDHVVYGDDDDEINNDRKTKDLPNGSGRKTRDHGDADGDQENDVDYDDDKEDFQTRLWSNVYKYTDSIQAAYDANRNFCKIVITAVLLLGFAAYLVYACIYDFEEAMVVLIITGITVFMYAYIFVRDTVGDRINEHVLVPGGQAWNRMWRYIEWPFYLALVALLAVALYFLTRENPENLVSFAGLVIFVVFCYIFSKHPNKVKWRPVLWGLALQFLLGLFILRTYAGFVIFEWLSDLVFTFLNFASAGSEFLFGAGYEEHYFAFAVLPIIIYFGSVISILYYWGVIQTVIAKVSWLMQLTMKTSAAESLNAAGNIFVGMTEAPLMIRPYLKDMTRSEIHAVMTGGFATVAGSTLGAYILAGIDATHLIAASVMSAPAALAISKLFYPETEKSKHLTAEGVKLPKGEERNMVEAAANGASTAIPLVLNIAANLVAFLSLLALVNALLGYFGGLVGYPELTFELICSYVFMPVAFIMGVEWADCNVVAELIGLKTFVNEFYAYDVLAGYIRNRDTGEGPTLSARSEVIATYALCGFANIGSVGIMLGGLTPMAPSRRKDLAVVAVRALVAGTVACFLTACIAGILYVPIEVVAGNATTTAIPAGTTLY